MLELYVDSADADALARVLPSGAFAGVTTNPLLLERAGLTSGDLPELVDRAREHGARTVFAQSWGGSAVELLDNARRLRDLGPELAVKVPVTAEGLACARRLVEEGTRVLVTAVYHPKQLLAAAAAGVDFVAPYVGRMTDAGRDGLADTLRMQRILDSLGSSTRLLAASLRSIDEALILAEGGIGALTFPPNLAGDLLHDEFTTQAVTDFERVAKRQTGLATHRGQGAR